MTKIEYGKFYGVSKRKNTLMVYNRHLEMQYKWDKVFWTKWYYVEIIGKSTDEAVPKYIKRKQKDLEKWFKRYRFIADQ